MSDRVITSSLVVESMNQISRHRHYSAMAEGLLGALCHTYSVTPWSWSSYNQLDMYQQIAAGDQSHRI